MLVRLQLNFLRPMRKLITKERRGSKVTKLYDRAQTPYQRLLAAGALDQTTEQRLQRELESINPADLQRRIDDALRHLWNCTERKERRKVG